MRIRTIKPEFWHSQDITDLDWDTRLVFIGLWSYVDDNGVGVDDDRLITADLFPLEENPLEVRAKVRDALSKLSRKTREGSRHPLITRYSRDGKGFIHITNWPRHQKIDKPSKPRYPLPGDEGCLAEQEESPSDSPGPDFIRESVARPSRLEQGNRGTEEQRNRGEEQTPAATSSQREQPAARKTDELFDALVAVCGINSAELTNTQRGSINGALKQLREVGASPEQVKVRAKRFPEFFKDATLTPPALAKHWGLLGKSRPSRSTTDDFRGF